MKGSFPSDSQWQQLRDKTGGAAPGQLADEVQRRLLVAKQCFAELDRPLRFLFPALLLAVMGSLAFTWLTTEHETSPPPPSDLFSLQPEAFLFAPH
ncbi:hypothetical protein [Roseibacillus ishigakijimensis]|uniref:hypothetical protein n=1 Tax=Roseibacillus ishigakijimensis TaxID=454146 RepID=UPI0019067802|nr:hypothetical protein [Roseibacillus ishigakijimensis]